MATSTLSRSLAYADMALQLRRMKSGGNDVRAQKARALLVQRMGRLRGLPQKVGQLLSMRDDQVAAENYASLNDAAEPMPFEDVRPLIESYWGRRFESIVETVDQHGIAASIGQVHRARLRDGREVAIKVQYPDMDRAVANDMRMLGWLSKPVGDLRRGFDLGKYQEELRRELGEELDYHQEARHQRAMFDVLAPCDGWVVPEVVDELSAEKVIVTAWEAGQTIDAVKDWPERVRRLLGRRLLNGFFHTLFRHGLIHADPNPGNYRFRLVDGDPEIILYDYGCCYRLDPQQQQFLLKLIQISIDQSGDPFKPLVGLGFDGDLLEPLRDKMPAVCRVLCAPFAGTNANPESWRLGERIGDILGEDRWNFRIAGPPPLIWLLRAFRGIAYYLTRIDAFVSWDFALRPFLKEFARELEAIDVSSPTPENGMEGQARHLRISVREGQREKVSLTFPALAVDDLNQLIDPDLRTRLLEKNIDPDGFIKEVRRNGYRPQSIFQLNDSNKDVRVWLE